MPLIKTHKSTILAPRYADEFFCSNDKVEVTTKRCSSTSPDSAPLHKSPRIENQYPTIQTSNGEELSETDQRELKPDDTDESSDHAANPATRKSFRRATITRRSVPALSSQHQRETFWGCCIFRIQKSTIYCFTWLLIDLLFACSFVQEHKHISTTAGETSEINGSFNEGEFGLM